MQDHFNFNFGFGDETVSKNLGSTLFDACRIKRHPLSVIQIFLILERGFSLQARVWIYWISSFRLWALETNPFSLTIPPSTHNLV